MSTPNPSIATSKCILVTGATSGIGRALALKFKELPSKPQVIAVGRRQNRLDELAGQGLETVQLDVQRSAEQLKNDLGIIVERYPDLDTVVLNAGIQHQFDFTQPESVNLNKVAEELNINYTSVLTTVLALMPHFQKLAAQGRECFFVGISSGLSMVPAAWVPNYAATKAAVHSLLMALRAQLADSKIHVVEVMPPLVESELHDPYGTTEALSKTWMTLEEFTKLTLDGLLKGDDDVPVGMSAAVFQKFEAGKSQMAIHLMKNHKAGKSY
ncbi:hypothetical protein PC9H_002057 [Pleurotus ostreatus]|uniref:Uncharacterized protein n=1 Tax=Pleurotus ostreatus TaxID=5322 RepID=A0A8H7DMR4_PLEOS|nr:uncharacterized protein PC9H_002057 [Pleurotus ostreatus]KAF7419467.1 hypothetical protein PC9H_002057 [Pleurotus ostreatus]KAJ8689725.1 hypothetical protein PTI98_012599 [Pleurotus ostreatus]